MTKKFTPTETKDPQKLVEEIAQHGRFVLTLLDEQGRIQYRICEPLGDQSLKQLGSLSDAQVRLLEWSGRLFQVQFQSERYPRRSLRVII